MMARFLRALDLAHQWIVAIAAIVIAGPVTWWAFDDTPPIAWTEVSVETPEVPAGGVMRLRSRFERSRACDGYSISTVIDSQGIVHESRRNWFDERSGRGSQPNARRPNGRFVQPQLVEIPLGAALGHASQFATYTWFCNPLQRMFNGLGIRASRPEVHFVILPARLARLDQYPKGQPPNDF